MGERFSYLNEKWSRMANVNDRKKDNQILLFLKNLLFKIP